tara:strand:+ start:458 stop:559 length:102 start_codon:yes stop_codon:yes gene_type:complete
MAQIIKNMALAVNYSIVFFCIMLTAEVDKQLHQ